MSFYLDKSYSDIQRDLSLKMYSADELLLESAKALSDGDPFRSFVGIRSGNCHYKTGQCFSGFPLAVKDIFNTLDFPTQMGSPIYKGFTPGNDARVVFNAKENGCVILGKTVTAEFAVHELNETQNPHDIRKSPGTSSSGSAVAVAKGYAPIAMGTQTAGSIIRPASFCGVIGFKPSFGLLPRTGVLKTCDPFDTIGFFATHLDYLGPFLDAIRVKGSNYPFVHQFVDQVIHSTNKKTKIGFLRTHTWDLAKNYVKDSILSHVNRLSKSFIVEEIKWPEELGVVHEIHEIIYAKSLSYYFQKEFSLEKSEISAVMQDMIERGNLISIEKFRWALGELPIIREKISRLISSFDCVITQSTGSSAPLRGEIEIKDPSLIWTMCHLPAVSIPLFQCPEKMPFGIQYISKKWNDFNLIRHVGSIYQGIVHNK